MKTDKQQAAAAAAFAQRWKGRGYERGESQPFWIDLLSNVYGIETPSDGFISFEDHRMVDASNFIDGRIPSTKVLIEQKAKIEQTAQAILDARAKYPDSSLADLYDELTMPVELRRAHQDNDRAVMAAYGFPIKTMTESQCVAELFKLYQQLTK